MSFLYQRRYRGPLLGVIVDWAGSMVDFGSRAPVEAFRSAFAHEGVEITVAEAREPMGLAKRDHIRTITRMARVAEAWRAQRGAAPGEEDVDRIYREFLPRQREILLRYGEVIDGAVEALAAFRERGLKIGSTTGYVKELMDVVVPEAERQGLHVDAMVCASDVSLGRPAPFMCWLNAMRLGIYPMAAMVKIGDTVADIEEGLAAGMWSVGLSRSGNEVGLSVEEQRALPPGELTVRVAAAERRLSQAGAHYVVETIAEAPAIVDEIAHRVARGEQP
jgi:phosphonoacetaldehyde hydrolase